MSAVGFEPTPLRTGALSQRLRPLGETVVLLLHANRVVGRLLNGEIMKVTAVGFEPTPLRTGA